MAKLSPSEEELAQAPAGFVQRQAAALAAEADQQRRFSRRTTDPIYRKYLQEREKEVAADKAAADTPDLSTAQGKKGHRDRIADRVTRAGHFEGAEGQAIDPVKEDWGLYWADKPTAPTAPTKVEVTRRLTGHEPEDVVAELKGDVLTYKPKGDPFTYTYNMKEDVYGVEGKDIIIGSDNPLYAAFDRHRLNPYEYVESLKGQEGGGEGGEPSPTDDAAEGPVDDFNLPPVSEVEAGTPSVEADAVDAADSSDDPSLAPDLAGTGNTALGAVGTTAAVKAPGAVARTVGGAKVAELERVGQRVSALGSKNKRLIEEAIEQTPLTLDDLSAPQRQFYNDYRESEVSRALSPADRYVVSRLKTQDAAASSAMRQAAEKMAVEALDEIDDSVAQSLLTRLQSRVPVTGAQLRSGVTQAFGALRRQVAGITPKGVARGVVGVLSPLPDPSDLVMIAAAAPILGLRALGAREDFSAQLDATRPPGDYSEYLYNNARPPSARHRSDIFKFVAEQPTEETRGSAIKELTEIRKFVSPEVLSAVLEAESGGEGLPPLGGAAPTETDNEMAKRVARASVQNSMMSRAY